MEIHHVALFCSEQLLGESISHLLSHTEGVALMGPWLVEESALSNLSEQYPDIVVIADNEPESEQAAILATHILDTYPEISVIRVTLAHNIARIYSSRALPASSTDLVNAIRKLPIRTALDESGQQDTPVTGGA